MLLERADSFRVQGCENSVDEPFSVVRNRNLALRLEQARRAFSTRNVDFGQAERLIRDARPEAGDLLLARVVTVGHHTKLESPQGRRQAIYPGDEIVVAFGNRYAPDQFEAVVPDDLGECDLVAGGGIAARMLGRHDRARRPTRIEPIGLLSDRQGRRLNLRQFRTVPAARAGHEAKCQVIVVVGTSMNAGKTTTAAQLIHGLTLAGLKVGAAKVTGTGSGGDLWSMIDAGARIALDFTDAGHATTAGLERNALVDDSLALIARVSEGNDFAVIEVADGLFQEETASLLKHPIFRAAIDQVILAAGDAMGAAFGHGWLQREGLPLSLIAGCVSSSPLGARETMRATGIRVATLAELGNAAVAPQLCLAPIGRQEPA